jgi:ABC-2 type transport system ATP-binding protein
MHTERMTAPPPCAIEVRGLRKRYGNFEAVRGIDLRVERAEVFALLGPNGAGKTTTVEILEGHRERDGGDVSVLGHDPQRHGREFHERIGIVLQSTGVEPYLTVEETIRQFAGFYPRSRPTDEILEVVGLTGQRHERVRRLSGGQQRRLDVAVGLAGDPDLLFLDEPTTGFDPAARRQAWGLVRNLQALGKTVFLTTHYMDEAQQLADRLAIIVGGEIVAEGAPSELLDRDHVTTIRFRRPPSMAVLVDGLPGELVIEGEEVTIRTTEPTRALALLTGRGAERGIELDGLSVSRASLEDVYLQLAGPAAAPRDGAGEP